MDIQTEIGRVHEVRERVYLLVQASVLILLDRLRIRIEDDAVEAKRLQTFQRERGVLLLVQEALLFPVMEICIYRAKF